MEELELDKKNIHNGNLILVNADYPLANGFESGISLMPAGSGYPDCLMESKAATVLGHVLDGLENREDIVFVSGYRTLKEQEQIWNDSVRDNGAGFTREYVAVPNHSEHQSGLAIDLGVKKEHIDFIRPDFPYEGVCNEFRKKALKYGFIERYRRNKERITGISAEPWHFRYVGYPHSMIMDRYGMCLEEYIEKLKEFTYTGRHLNYKSDNQIIEIFYIPASENEILLNLPDNSIYQVSGNNIDGFIITLWRQNYENWGQ